MFDTTYDTEEDKNTDNPLIYNFIVSIPPNKKNEIESFLEKSDEEKGRESSVEKQGLKNPIKSDWQVLDFVINLN